MKSGLSVSEIVKACITRALPYIEILVNERLTQTKKDGTV